MYSNTFRSKERDALEIFTEQNSELGKREDRDEYWGALSNPSKIEHSGVNAIDKALKEKVAVFSRFRYNPLETLSKIRSNKFQGFSGFFSEDWIFKTMLIFSYFRAF